VALDQCDEGHLGLNGAGWRSSFCEMDHSLQRGRHRTRPRREGAFAFTAIDVHEFRFAPGTTHAAFKLDGVGAATISVVWEAHQMLVAMPGMLLTTPLPQGEGRAVGLRQMSRSCLPFGCRALGPIAIAGSAPSNQATASYRCR